jgi:RNA polymerase subunit RPABC4/transcription elongation factor Spt4/TM2 domain-containing membrane protein YozV
MAGDERGDDASATAGEKHCVACGELIGENAELCPDCGVRQQGVDLTGEKHCVACGSDIDANAELCPDCGVRQPATGGTSEKEPGVAAVISLLFPGGGQAYNGQIGRGLLVFFGWMAWGVVAFLLTTITLGLFGLLWLPIELLVHALVAYDAYDQAEKINAGEVTLD